MLQWSPNNEELDQLKLTKCWKSILYVAWLNLKFYRQYIKKMLSVLLKQKYNTFGVFLVLKFI